MHMRKAIIAGAVGLAGIAGATGVAFAGGSSSAGSAAPPSRLDDGKALLPQATITEQQAIAAAQRAASGALNEVDLEHYQGTLVFNVDVGRRDVKVDAGDGSVLAAPQDDEAGSN
jgi:uncharacterized membrane protein YkoI